MAIKIRTKKEVDGYGHRCRRILNIDCIPFSDLPEEYTHGIPAICLSKEDEDIALIDCNTFKPIFEKGQLVTEEYYQEWIEFIRQAGYRLAEINKKHEEVKKEWYGVETVKI